MNEIGIVIERQSNEEQGSYKPKRIPFWRVIHLGHYFYWIAFVQHAFDQNRAVNARHALVSLRYFLQYRRHFFSGIGVERDHHAAWIALENRDDHLRPDPQRLTHERILAEAFTRR